MTQQNQITNQDRAKILVEAVPYIREYLNNIVVIKYGSNAIANQDLKKKVIEDIVRLSYLGVRVVLVHSVGPEINALLNNASKGSKFLAGLKLTDKGTIEYLQKSLAKKVNKDLVNLLHANGGKAEGLLGIDDKLIQADIKGEKLSLAGEIKKINKTPIIEILKKGCIPVISSLGCDSMGSILNVNTNSAASYIASELRAKAIVVITNIAGILREKDDPKTLISKIDLKEAEKLLKENAIPDTLVPKVECYIEAIDKGVEKVFIVDGRIPHSILLELLTDKGVGTMLVKN